MTSCTDVFHRQPARGTLQNHAAAEDDGLSEEDFLYHLMEMAFGELDELEQELRSSVPQICSSGLWTSHHRLSSRRANGELCSLHNSPAVHSHYVDCAG
jgi:hypothetical protein